MFEEVQHLGPGRHGLLHIAVWGCQVRRGQLLERVGSGWTQGGRENHMLIREFCGTDHITPFQGMGDLLIACIPGLQKNSAKQWGPADFGASESTYLAGPWSLEFLRAKAPKLSSGFQAPTVLPHSGSPLLQSPTLPAKYSLSP